MYIVHENRGLLYLIGAGAILLLGVFWYSQMYVIEEENLLIDTVNEIISPGSIADPTQNWKTYRNEEFGFELKYPKHFYVFSESYPDAESPPGIVYSVVFADEKYRDVERMRPFIELAIFKSENIESETRSALFDGRLYSVSPEYAPQEYVGIADKVFETLEFIQ